jgi:hypothetical protein
MGEPLDPHNGTAVSPAPPQGFNWYAIDGAICRDGSPTGFYVRFTSSDKLVIYLEGGGACSSPGFCTYNPANVAQSLSGGGETVLGSALGVMAARQQPGVYTNGALQGIFDTTNAANPFKDWNQIYVPYCTGDVHFGTHRDATVTGVATPQQFVGYLNMQKFMSRIVPTFKDKLSRVILTGASAGSFGAALNFSMVQDAFGSVPVDAIGDSGPPFSDQYMPACMQKRWRELWGLDAALPPDCTECFQADGGGMIGMADFLMRKHPNAKVALISSMQDEVIRLFFSSGLRNCAGFETADPVAITMGQIFPDTYYPADQYTAALNDLRARFSSTGRLATYYMGGLNVTLHQHTFRPRFFEAAAGGETLAQFVTEFLAGDVKSIGP